MIAWGRLKALIVKELLSILRDKRARFLLIIPPLMQLFILANAVTLEVKNISLVYFNEDNGWYSHELIERIKGSSYFTNVFSVYNEKDLQKVIDNQDAIVAIHFANNYSRQMAKGKPSNIQMIMDGRRSNASQIAQGYILRMLQDFNVDVSKRQGNKHSTGPLVVFRSWFNPNLDYILYTVPCLVGILSMILGLMVTALSVAREREMGTFDQLLVSPLTITEIIAGKMIPALIIGLAESTLMMILAIVIYEIPFRGPLLLFYVSMMIFILSIIGVGLFISSLSQTQQQALLGTFIFIVPTMLLSGFATPIENIPNWLQPLSWMIPITHFFVIVKGVFLKDMGVKGVLVHAWPMVIIGFGTLTAAGWMFKRKLE